jgi:hypothetical protein
MCRMNQQKSQRGRTNQAGFLIDGAQLLEIDGAQLLEKESHEIKVLKKARVDRPSFDHALN